MSEHLTFSQAWKIPLVLFMIGYIIKQRIISVQKFNKGAYLFGIKNIFNQAIFTHPITNIIETFRFTNFPLLYDTFNIYFKTSLPLYKLTVRFSQYFILSAIPFLLGIMTSVRQGMEFGEKESFIGIFQNSHGASIISCFAVLVLINHIKTYKISLSNRIYNLFLIFLGVFCLYLAFVRTGYLMFAIGLFVLFLPSTLSKKQLIMFLVVSISLILGFSHQMSTNDSFRHRILDQTNQGVQHSRGSGRIDFAMYSLQYWAEGDFQQLLFGRGLDNVEDNLKNKVGIRVYSHNGFVDALAINGLIGLFLLLLFIMLMFKNIRRNREHNMYRLSIAMFFCYISYQLTQGGAGFPIDLYMVSILNLLNKEQNRVLEPDKSISIS